jgi:hypothetical protein
VSTLLKTRAHVVDNVASVPLRNGYEIIVNVRDLKGSYSGGFTIPQDVPIISSVLRAFAEPSTIYPVEMYPASLHALVEPAALFAAE